MSKNIKILALSLTVFLVAGGVAGAQNLKELEKSELDAMLPPVRSFECMKISNENDLYLRAMEFLGSDRREDLDAAADCMLMSALKEHAKAQYEIAKMYYGGIGVPKSLAHAYKWAIKSSLNDNKDTEKFVAMLEKEITISELKYAVGEVNKTFVEFEELETWEADVRAKMEFEKLASHFEDFKPYYLQYLNNTLADIDAVFDGGDPILYSRTDNDKTRDQIRKNEYMSEIASQMSKRHTKANESPYEKRKKLDEKRKRERIKQAVDGGPGGRGGSRGGRPR